MSKIEIDTLSNGVRVVSERMQDYQSAALNVFVNTGSVYERPGEGGISHFIEHMLFKGTDRRSALDIASEMDAIGGNMNAFTAKECTCFYARVLNENLSTACDMLSDIYFNSKFDEAEMQKEKGVVCEEILMTDDTPDDVVHEAVCSLYYKDQPLAKPILGTRESVNAFLRDDIKDYMSRNYTPRNTVISCAGSFDHDKLLAELETAFGRESKASQLNTAIPVDEVRERRFCAIEKDVEQVHICIALPAVMLEHRLSIPFMIMNNVFGGSMSSRLFQKIREQMGLAYSVYSYVSSYRNTGYFTLYAGTGEKQAASVYELLLAELKALRENGITQEDFLRSKSQLRGSYLMGLESTAARSSAIGKSMLMRGFVRSYEETIALLNSASMDEVRECIDIATDFCSMSTAIVGRTAACREKIEGLAL